jgi:hypothetical protein
VAKLRALSAEERKQRLKEARKFEEHARNLRQDNLQVVENLLKDCDLNEEYKKKLLKRAEADRKRQLMYELEYKKDVGALEKIMDSNVISTRKKVEIVDSVKYAISNHMADPDIFDGFMDSEFFTEEEKDHALFNIAELTGEEFIGGIDRLDAVEKLFKIINKKKGY